MSADQVKTTYTELLGWPDDGELFRRLLDYADATGALALASPIDIVFSEHDVLEPDIVVFTAARRHHVQPDQVIRVPPDVAVEVISPGTAANDRGRKLRTFERFGVPEYWILDPHTERLDVLALRDGRYASPTSMGRGEHITSSVLPGFECDVAALFAT